MIVALVVITATGLLARAAYLLIVPTHPSTTDKEGPTP